MCGCKSSRLLRLTAAYAVAASKCEACSILIVLQVEIADGVTFFQVAAASLVTWILPSSLPTQIRPSLTGDGAMVRMVPGACLGFFGSTVVRVRAGLMTCQLAPALVVFT